MTLDGLQTQVGEEVRLGQLVHHRLGTDHWVAQFLGETFDARGHVDCVANGRVIVPRLRAQMPDDGLAHMQADTNGDGCPALSL